MEAARGSDRRFLDKAAGDDAGRVLDAYSIHPCGAGAGAARLDELVDLVRRPDRDQFNAAVAPVSHPSVKPQPVCDVGGPGAIADALDIAGDPHTPRNHRSEERRVGKECVSTCRSLWSPYH